MSYTLRELAERLGAECHGDEGCVITSVAPLDDAGVGDITFLSNPRYAPQLSDCGASAVILSRASLDSCTTNALVMDNPYLGYARVAQLLDNSPVASPGVHATAQVHDTVTLGKDVCVGPNCVIEANVVLEDGVVLLANCYIGQGSHIRARTKMYANVTVYHNVRIGEACIVHAGTVIGADGFGFANEKGQWVKIPQTGGVTIGDDVEIGANCTIDRGALRDTTIGNGVKIDNICHIAHNVEIGDACAMAGFTGIAGSAKIGKGCTLSGNVGVLGHLSLCDNVHVTAKTLVNKTIDKPGVYSSGTVFQENKEWRKSVARFRQLDEMHKKIRQLERQLDDLNKERPKDE